MSGSVRVGTPLPPTRSSIRARSAAIDTVRTTTNVAIWTGMPKPKYAVTAATTAAALMKAHPKCGTDTSRTAASRAIASQKSDPISATHDENSDDRSVVINGIGAS